MARPGRRAEVLICEDYAPILRITSRYLERAGYGVSIAEQPEEALRQARRLEQLELLLVDFDLPGMRGNELARQIEELHPGVAVVLMSGHLRDVRGIGELGRGWLALRKPFTSAQLLEAVDAVLGSRA